MKNRLISIVIMCILIIGGFVGLITFESENAQGTDISGVVYDGSGGPWTAIGGPYIVVGDVIVPAGETLTIEPDVIVKFDGYHSIYVDGTLMAIGTKTSRINITSNMITPAPGDWNRIQVNSTGHAEINYCDITYADKGISLYSSSNNNIKNNNLFNNGKGIHLWLSSNNSIMSNYISSNSWGIYPESSSNNTISNNNILNNVVDGIYLWSSSNNNNITGNNVSNNRYGIWISQSSNSNIITNNNISLNNNIGISLSSSSYNNIAGNNISLNNDYGIRLSDSTDTNVADNTMIGNGIFLGSGEPEYWNTHNIDTSNTVNGKTVYYWKNQTGGTIPPGAGQVILANCTNIKIENQELNHASVGILLGYSSNNKITGNTASNNKYGIYLVWGSSGNNITGNNFSSNSEGGIWLRYSSGNNDIVGNNISGNCNPANNAVGITLDQTSKNNITGNTVSNNDCGIALGFTTENTITDNYVSLNNRYGLLLRFPTGNDIIGNTIHLNKEYGIYLSDSNDNTFHHNNIIDNINQVYLDTATCFNNVWDDGLGEGNYWSDYGGVDINGDGVGDTEIPHPFADQGNGYYQLDNYPLVNPLGGFIILYEGWNLISIPFIQSDTNLGTVLSLIKGLYDAVQWYNVSDASDPWKHYHMSKPSDMNDLNEINHRIGFWIHISEPGGVLFEYTGTQPLVNQTIQLHPGWNLVGYPSPTNHNRTEGLNKLEFGTDVDAIQWFDASNRAWHFLEQDDYFVPGRGYWIHSKVEKVWEVPL